MEIWLPIEDYPTYSISNLGQVRNSRKKILKQRYSKDGYLRIGLCKNSKQNWFAAHRLVAQAFLKFHKKPNYQVHHINAIKDDNRVENLQWVSVSENQKEARQRCPWIGNFKKNKQT